MTASTTRFKRYPIALEGFYIWMSWRFPQSFPHLSFDWERFRANKSTLYPIVLFFVRRVVSGTICCDLISEFDHPVFHR